MRDRKDILIDLVIELVGASIVAVLAWAATVAAGTFAIPVWAVVVIAVAVGFAVVVLVAYAIRTRHLLRTQSALNEARGSALAANDSLRQLRDLHRMVADQLQVGDDPKVLKHVASYTVDPGGNDRIESVWTLSFAEPHQGRVFITEDWSAHPAPGSVSCTCHSDTNVGTAVVPVLIVDEPMRKKSALHLHPPVGTTLRQLEVKQTWPDLWKDLRENGADYMEMSARAGLQEATILIYIPAALGQFKWVPTTDPGMTLSSQTTGAQQTLKMVVSTPAAGHTYRADLLKA